MNHSRSSTLPRTTHLVFLLTFTAFLNVALALPMMPSRPLTQDYGGTPFACTQDTDCQTPTMYCNLNNPQAPFCDCGIFHTWSVEHHSCVGLVNTSCARGRLCAKHSFCNDDQWCQCNEKHIATKNRRCLLRYGSPCDPFDTIDSCNHELLLVCNLMTKRCDCKYWNQMKYDKSVNECRMLIGEPCDPLKASYYREYNMLQHKCVKGGICWQKTPSNKVGQCYCEGYYLQDPVTKDCVAPRSQPIIVERDPTELEFFTHRAIQLESVEVTDPQMGKVPITEVQTSSEKIEDVPVTTDQSVIPENLYPTTENSFQKVPSHSVRDHNEVPTSSSLSLCPLFILISITLVVVI